MCSASVRCRGRDGGAFRLDRITPCAFHIHFLGARSVETAKAPVRACQERDFWVSGGRELAPHPDRGYLNFAAACSLRLAAQDVALSRRKQGFESPRERQSFPKTLESQKV